MAQHNYGATNVSFSTFDTWANNISSDFKNGIYSLNGLQAGTYYIKVNSPGYFDIDGNFWSSGYEKRSVFYN